MIKQKLLFLFATLIIASHITPICKNNAEAKAPDDKLWMQAVGIAGKNNYWVPGILEESERIHNGNGKVHETTKRRFRFSLAGNSKLYAALEKSVLNGKDITKKEQKHFDSKTIIREYLDENEAESPFSEKTQPAIQVKRSPETAIIDSTECTVFQYRLQVEKVTWNGTAWIEKETGMPVKLHYHTNNSFKENNATISNFNGTIFYSHENPESWKTEQIEYKMNINIKVFPFQSFSGMIQSEYTLGEYFMLEE